MEQSRILKWVGGIVILGAIVWGVVALEKSSQQMEANLTPPQVDAVTENDQLKGNPEAEVTLIEYGDFQCPACAAYFPIVKRLAEDYSQDLRVVYRHFPLTSIHRNARSAAEAAEAAGRQGKFWEMHDLLFTNQSEWENVNNPETLYISYAESLGLDMNQFTADMASGQIRDRVESHRQAAVQAGLSSTPTFLLNGELIRPPQNYQAFSELIEQKINEQQQSDNTTDEQSATTTDQQTQ